MGPKFWNELLHLSTLPVLCLSISCFVGLRYWKRLPETFRILVIYLLFNLFIEIAARIAGFVYAQNLPLLHLYTLGECLIFSLFYREILDEHSFFKRYFYWILGTCLSLTLLNTIFVQGIFEFNSYAKTMVQVLIILYALDYAFRMSNLERFSDPQTKALQLVNAAVLIYYSGSLFVFMSGQFEIQMGAAIRILWKINTVLNLIFQIMLLIALWKIIYTPQRSSSSRAQAS